MIKKAEENSLNRFRNGDVGKRITLAKELADARRRDAVASKLIIDSKKGWALSFGATLQELSNNFYSMDLLSEVKNHSFGKLNYNLIDLGCGPGNAAKELAKLTKGKVKVIGTGVKRLPSWDKTSEVNWKVLHAENLEKHFKPGTVDFIHSNLGLAHSYDLVKSVESCSRILKKGGRLLFTIDGSSYHKLNPGDLEGFKLLKFLQPNKYVWVFYLEKL